MNDLRRADAGNIPMFMQGVLCRPVLSPGDDARHSTQHQWLDTPGSGGAGPARSGRSDFV